MIKLEVLTAHDPLNKLRTTDTGLSIKGQVKEQDTPLQCRVNLFEKWSGKFIETQLTDEFGFYEFNQLAKAKFFIIAHHPRREFNAVIQDNLEPK